MAKINKKIKVALGLFTVFGGVTLGEHNAAASVPNDFINKIKQPVKTVSKKYNLYGSIMMAQASLESGWGQSALSVQANNFFGIKGSYNGQSVTMLTAEDDGDGNLYYVNAQFKKYPNFEASLNDNGNLLRNGLDWSSTYYSGAWRENAKTYQDAARALTGTYATDTQYATRLIDLIQSYGMDKLVDNLGDTVVSSKDIYRVAVFNQDHRNDGLYQDGIWNTGGEVYVGGASQYNGKSVTLVQEATTSKGTKWYAFKRDGHLIWVDSAAFKSVSDITARNTRTMFIQNNRNDGLYKNAPYGFVNATHIGTVSSTNNNRQSITIEKEAKVNSTLWYAGYLNGELYWFDSKAVVVDNSVAKDANYVTKITQSGRNDGIYIDKPWEYRTDYFGSAKQFDGKYVLVTGEWKTPDGVTWIRFNYNGKTLWMDKTGASSKVAISNVYQRALFNAYKNQDDGLYEKQPGVILGSKSIGTTKSTDNERKSITLEKKVVFDGQTWYAGKLNGKEYWFKSQLVQNDNSAPVGKSYTAVVDQDQRNDGMYLDKPWEYRTDFYKSAKDINGRKINVKQEWKTPDGVTWVNFVVDGKSVWLDKAGIQSTSLEITNTYKRAMFIQNGRNDGLYLNEPYGIEGSEFTGTVSSTGNDRKSITVEKMLTYKGVTWYGGYLNGKLYWFDSKAVVEDTSTAVAANYQVVINQNGRNDGLYLDKPWEYRSTYFSSAQKYNGQKVTVKQQWTTPDGVTWINFVIDGKSVWMDANGSASPMYQRAMFIQGNRNDGLYENAPYGYSAAKYLGSVKATGNDQKSITVEMSRVLNGVLWYAGYLDGRVYWFDSAAVVNDATAPVSVNYSATVSQSNRNDGLYFDMPWEYRAQYAGTAKVLDNQRVTVTQEWRTPDGVVWAAFVKDGRTIWVDKNALKMN